MSITKAKMEIFYKIGSFQCNMFIAQTIFYSSVVLHPILRTRTHS